MSKRKQSDSFSGDASGDRDRDKHALVMAEQRLFDVQCYAHDVIQATSALSEGGGIKKSTRAYYDPLLNMEIKILRDREEELLVSTTLTALIPNASMCVACVLCARNQTTPNPTALIHCTMRTVRTARHIICHVSCVMA